MVTFGYQRYQVLHVSMLCTWSTVTSVTWLLPVVTFNLVTMRYQVLHSLCCVRGVRLPPLPGDYLWLPLVTSVTSYCMTLCCVRGVWLPPLPGGYLRLLCVTSVTRYCMTLCCVRGAWLPPLPVLPVVTMCYQRYQILHDSMLCIYVV